MDYLTGKIPLYLLLEQIEPSVTDTEIAPGDKRDGMKERKRGRKMSE